MGARCARCGFLPKTVGVIPMEYVVKIPTGLHRVDGGHRRAKAPRLVKILYAAGLLVWLLPILLWLYYRGQTMPGASLGWRALGLVLAALLAGLVNTLCFAGAFFYGRLVTSLDIADEADRGTTS